MFFCLARAIGSRVCKRISLLCTLLVTLVELDTAITAGYFGLIVALVGAMSLNQRHKKSPELLMREHAQEQHWDMR